MNARWSEAARLLKNWRTTQRMTQARLATEVEVSIATISRLESAGEESEPPNTHPGTLYRLAALMGFSRGAEFLKLVDEEFLAEQLVDDGAQPVTDATRDEIIAGRLDDAAKILREVVELLGEGDREK